MATSDKYASFEVEMSSPVKSKPPSQLLKYERHETTQEEMAAKQKSAEERRKVSLKKSSPYLLVQKIKTMY